MHIHREFLQRILEIIAVATEPFQRDSAQWVHNDLVGVAGQEILILGIIVANCDNWLAGGPEHFQRLDNFLGLADPHVPQGVEFQYQGADCRIFSRELYGIQ